MKHFHELKTRQHLMFQQRTRSGHKSGSSTRPIDEECSTGQERICIRRRKLGSRSTSLNKQKISATQRFGITAACTVLCPGACCLFDVNELQRNNQKGGIALLVSWVSWCCLPAVSKWPPLEAMYTCVYVRMCVLVSVCLCVCVCVCMHVCMYACMHVSRRASNYACMPA